MKKKFCKAIGCSELIHRDQTYCHIHRTETTQKREHYDKQRGSSPTRGYDRAWRKVRNDYLRKHPLCERCNAKAIVVHHRTPITKGGERLKHSNLEALCHRCHNKEHKQHGASQHVLRDGTVVDNNDDEGGGAYL